MKIDGMKNVSVHVPQGSGIRLWRGMVLLVAMYMASAALALSPEREARFVAKCMSDWLGIMPNMGEPVARRMCECIGGKGRHLDDSLSDEEIMQRASGPPDIEAQPEVFTECIQPALLSAIQNSKDKLKLPPEFAPEGTPKQ